MALYQYRCLTHGDFDSTLHSSVGQPCPVCSNFARRVWTMFRTNRIQIEKVYNSALGEWVSSEQEMKDRFKAKSDEMSARLGNTVNYSPVDPDQKSAYGVTDEGLESTYRTQHDLKASN